MCQQDANPEAERLRRKTVVTAAAVACVGGFPAMLSRSSLGHHGWIAAGFIVLQLALLTRALQFMAQRKRLLGGSR